MARMKSPIYLDHNATTPPAPEVVEAMTRALVDLWGNPSSAHVLGRAAREAIDSARAEVADLLGCAPDEILFTGGGTESDNLAVVGVAEARERDGRHIVISNVEHAAVEKPCAWLETRGWQVTRIAVGSDGTVEAAAFVAALRPDTVLASLMLGNNETGALQPVAEIACTCRERGVTVHTDAAQAVGKMPVRVDDLCVDLLTIAGHKFYGPKGIGALYVRRGTPLVPYLRGAGHERGLRSGTEPTAEIVGLGVACRLAKAEAERRAREVSARRDRLETGLRTPFPDLVVHAGTVPRLPNTAYVAFPGIDANALVAACPEVAMGVGAACHSGKTEPSRVLKAMGVDPAIAASTVRLSLGSGTTDDDVDRAVAALVAAAAAVNRSGLRKTRGGSV